MEFIHNINVLGDFNPNIAVLLLASLSLFAFITKLAKKLIILLSGSIGLPLALGFSESSSAVSETFATSDIVFILTFFILGLTCSSIFKANVSWLYRIVSLGIFVVVVGLGFISAIGSDITIFGIQINSNLAGYYSLSFVVAALIVAIIRLLVASVPFLFWSTCTAVLFVVLAPGMGIDFKQLDFSKDKMLKISESVSLNDLEEYIKISTKKFA